MASQRPARPRSPHLSIWRWGPHMLVSILHRVTGDGMALVGTVLFVWWLAALASGPEAYALFLAVFTVDGGALTPIGLLFGIGLTFAFCQHLMSGIRHLMLDTGAGYDLRSNKRFAQATIVCSIILTAAYWAYLLAGK
ncbi:MAG: succinate dehydrogenase, cytochrome b556 subunit [Sphingomonas sp.]|uniref:succinate dehydrogenase, cytochrome b556 subunit n=1 Tax=Sphingomonas sp. TaxID=28214 RepID=UPI0017933417|nr:succinate dehydrogenase, cytochrome b556 subunit [Sphingomonas sp.]